jgi:hypothetical protein
VSPAAPSHTRGKVTVCALPQPQQRYSPPRRPPPAAGRRGRRPAPRRPAPRCPRPQTPRHVRPLDRLKFYCFAAPADTVNSRKPRKTCQKPRKTCPQSTCASTEMLGLLCFCLEAGSHPVVEVDEYTARTVGSSDYYGCSTQNLRILIFTQNLRILRFCGRHTLIGTEDADKKGGK